MYDYEVIGDLVMIMPVSQFLYFQYPLLLETISFWQLRNYVGGLYLFAHAQVSLRLRRQGAAIQWEWTVCLSAAEMVCACAC